MKQRGPRHFKPEKTTPKGWRDTLDIVDLSDDGRGLARRAGKAVFVSGALTGEQVDARSLRIGGRYDEATTMAVLQRSPERATPQCRHYDDCGGCQLQHLTADAQRTHKSQRFAAAMSRLQRTGHDIHPPIAGQMWHYRHRIRLHFSVNQGEVKLGFRAAKSRRITEVPECQLTLPALSLALQKIYEDKTPLQKLHSGMLMLAEAEGGAVCAHLSLERQPTQTAVVEFVSVFPVPVSGIDYRGETLWTDENLAEGYYPGQRWRFRPDDFSQVNPEVNSAIVDTVCSWLAATKDDRVLDAFSGLGNFAMALAASGAHIRGVELDVGMTARAADNARDLPQLTFTQGDLFSESYPLPADINKLVLDPPRAGAAALCRQLAGSAVERIVYVSCDLATLERDAGILLAGGYTLSRALWADMFPQSYHIETLCLFERKAAS